MGIVARPVQKFQMGPLCLRRRAMQHWHRNMADWDRWTSHVLVAATMLFTQVDKPVLAVDSRAGTGP